MYVSVGSVCMVCMCVVGGLWWVCSMRCIVGGYYQRSGSGGNEEQQTQCETSTPRRTVKMPSVMKKKVWSEDVFPDIWVCQRMF